MPEWTDDQIAEIAKKVSNWGRWGKEDELGTVNLITLEARARAAAEVKTGESVSLGRPLPLGTSPLIMNSSHVVWRVFQPVDAASEYIGLAFHGAGVTHIDALCHIFNDGETYNGFSASTVVPKTGAAHCSIEPVASRVSGRGVLLDVARAKGVDSLDNQYEISAADLDEAEAFGKTRVGSGDLLFVRTGADLWEHEHGSPGLGVDAVEWIHEREVSIYGSDVATDAFPTRSGRWALPAHQLLIVHLGMPLIDNCSLESASEACARNGRYSFFAVLVPLRIMGGTGSPVNPLAIF